MIAITGASGWIGNAVARELTNAGTVCRRLMRTPVDENDVGFELADLNWSQSWPEALEGCDVVIHCAAHVHRSVESQQERHRFQQFNVVGLRRVLEIADRVGVRRFIFVSSAAVYGQIGSTASEFSPLRASTFYGQTKIAGEEIVRQFAGDWRIARLATVYGTGDRGNFNRLAIAMARGRFVLPGQGTARKSVVSVADAARVLKLMAMEAGLERSILNIASPSAPSIHEICDAFTTVCGFPRPHTIPPSVLRGLGLCGDLMGHFFGRSPVTSQMVRALTQSTVLNVGKMCGLFPQLEWSDFKSELQNSRDYYRAVGAAPRARAKRTADGQTSGGGP